MIKNDSENSMEEDMQGSPQYPDASSKLQEMPGVFPYPPQALDPTSEYHLSLYLSV